MQMTPIPTFVMQFFGPVAALQFCGCPFFVRTWAKCWMASRGCIMGECACYKVKKLPLCPIELRLDELIQWHSIGHEVIGHIEEGKEKKASKVEFDQTLPKKLIY